MRFWLLHFLEDISWLVVLFLERPSRLSYFPTHGNNALGLAVSDWRIGRPSSADVSATGGPFPIRFRLPAAAGSHRSREKGGSNVAGGAVAW